MTSPTPRPPCLCAHFEEDPEGDGACMCGHAPEEHAPTRGYPNDRSCKADDDG